jgi:hypothetical protein
MLNEDLISAAHPTHVVKDAHTITGHDRSLANADLDPRMDDKEKADRLSKRLSTLATTKPSLAPVFGRTSRPGPADKKKRAKDRTPTFKAGRVVFSGRSEAPCVIKDLSDSGARIVLEGEASLPPQVTLVIATTGSRKEASVVWQVDREVGLSFAEG